MKLKFLLTTSLLGLGAATMVLAQEVKLNVPDKTAAKPVETNPVAATPAATAPQVSDITIVETFGWFVTARLGISELQFTPEQIQAFAKGVALAAAGQQPPHDLKTVGPVMDQFIGQRQKAAMEREKQLNLEEANTFFTELKKRPGVVALADGLCYEILKPGEGANVGANDTVKINYKGMLLSGQVFDSSEQHGEPLTIELAKAIPGWAEGVQQINKGGKIRLFLPPQLAYGDEGAGTIPPGAALIFEIEVLEINPTPAPAPTAK